MKRWTAGLTAAILAAALLLGGCTEAPAGSGRVESNEITSERESNCSFNQNSSIQDNTEKSDGEISKSLLLQSTGNTWFFEQNTLRFSYHNGKAISAFPDDWTVKIFHKETLPDADAPVSIIEGKTAVVCADGNALVIVYSDDQGKTWSASQPIPANTIPFRASVMPGMLESLDAVGCVSLSFISDSGGYLLIGSQLVMQGQPNRVLFKTTDGVQNWNFVDPGLAVEDNGAWKIASDSASAIPILQGAGVIDRIFFVDEELGFLCGYSGAEVNTARIFRTRDGGKTADVQLLPLPASGVDMSARVLLPYLRDGTIYLPVRINSEPSVTQVIFFSSFDLGDTWVYEETMRCSSDVI